MLFACYLDVIYLLFAVCLMQRAISGETLPRVAPDAGWGVLGASGACRPEWLGDHEPVCSAHFQ